MGIRQQSGQSGGWEQLGGTSISYMPWDNNTMPVSAVPGETNVDVNGMMYPTAIINSGTVIGAYAAFQTPLPTPGEYPAQDPLQSFVPASLSATAMAAGSGTPVAVANANSVSAINDNGDILGMDTNNVPSLWLTGTTKVAAPGSGGAVYQMNKNLQAIPGDGNDTGVYHIRRSHSSDSVKRRLVGAS